MMVERSKLRPVNISKQDATKAIFKERQSVGASMADIQPMEMDMNVTFVSTFSCQWISTKTFSDEANTR